MLFTQCAVKISPPPNPIISSFYAKVSVHLVRKVEIAGCGMKEVSRWELCGWYSLYLGYGDSYSHNWDMEDLLLSPLWVSIKRQ